MDLKFKPKFFRDTRKIKDKDMQDAIAKTILNIKSAKDISHIYNLKKLGKYVVHYRVKIKLDEKRDYRMGLVIRGKIVYFHRCLPRTKVYEEFP